MSVKSGFFNSLNHDRRYDARDFSRIIDTLLIDGVFASVGTAFVVEAAGGLTVNVGIGRAWFNETYTDNDAILPLEAPDSDLLLDRIDAVVIEVNNTEFVRDNTIKFVTGDASSNPVRPTLTNEGDIHQYPLCYIYRSANDTEIIQANITNMVGTEETPFVTGILQVIDLDTLLGQWRDQLDRIVANESADIDTWTNVMTKTMDEWTANEQTDFLNWYQSMKDQLSEDAAGNLQLQIDKEEVERLLLVGFADGSKEFSDDGTIITSTAKDGRTLTKTFTNNFLTMTTVLKSSAGVEVARMVKNFDATGKLIDVVTTYA